MLELLIVKKEDNGLRVIGTHPADMPVVDSSTIIMKASRTALEIVKDSLRDGKNVFVSEHTQNSEVLPSDLVVSEGDNPLEVAKNLAYNDITNLINQNVFGMSVLDSIDYLNCMMKLMSVGIFITDENREDKYFEIIEAAQTTEEPKPLSDGSTFEDEQEYLEQKRKYDQAQNNLTTLEKYLNAYDKISKIKFVNDLLNNARESIERSATVEDVDKAIREYCAKVRKYFCAKPCTA